MATYNIKWLRNLFGTRFFPVTHITAVRDNNNVNLETLLNNKADEATTLAGYGITDAYTKTESKSIFFSLKDDGTMGITVSQYEPIDLNTKITVGNYYVKLTTGSLDSQVQNYPKNTRIESTSSLSNGAIFHLHVLQPNSSIIKQQFQWDKSQILWERKTTDGGTTWTDWVVIATDLYYNFIGLKGQIQITPNSDNLVDLDTFDTVGTYSIKHTNSNSQYISNLPSDYSNYVQESLNLPFNLYVINTDPDYPNHILQRIRSDRQYYQAWERIYITTTHSWSPWALVQDDLSKYALSAGSSSDARLKDKVDDINLNIEDIAKAPNLTFKWKNGKDDNLHGGTYALYWENITPYYVHGSDSKTLEYGNLALTCSIELAKEMTKLKEENIQLKKELEDIKETLNKLNK